MSGAQWFWTVVGVLVGLRIIYNCYMRWWGVTGRHHTHYWDSDMGPPRGSVWMHKGVWYTQPRFAYACPRRFNERSNPLDVPTVFEEFEVPIRKRRIEREVEY